MIAIPDILTPDEAAELIKVPRRTILLMCERQDLVGARKAGRQWRIPRWSIDQYFGRRSGDDAGLQEGRQVEGADLAPGSPERLDRRGNEEGRGGVRGSRA